MKSLRSLIEGKVIFDFERGLDEVGLAYIIMARRKGGVSAPAAFRYEVEPGHNWPVPTDIRHLVKELTDEELLVVLDQQACQNYR